MVAEPGSIFGKLVVLAEESRSYWEVPPSNRTKDRWGNGIFIYNGIDRVDPSGGYTLDNVTPACIICNRAKSDMTIVEFTAWVKRLTQLKEKTWPILGTMQ